MRRSVFLFIILFAACSSGIERQRVEIDPAGWKEGSIRWIYDNHDTLNTKELALVFDYDDPAALLNDTFVVEIYFPESNERFEQAVRPVTDTTEFHRVIVASGVKFIKSGKHRLLLTPLQKTVGVKGVTLEMTKMPTN